MNFLLKNPKKETYCILKWCSGKCGGRSDDGEKNSELHLELEYVDAVHSMHEEKEKNKINNLDN